MRRMKKSHILLMFLALYSLACLGMLGCLLAAVLVFPSLQTLDVPQTPSLPACEAALPSLAQQSYDGNAIGEELSTEYTLITYVVYGDDQLIVHEKPYVPEKFRAYQEDAARHRELWNLFVRLVPPQYLHQVDYFTLTTDGPAGNLGSVVQMTDSRDRWWLYLDIQDAEHYADLVTTLIHEINHLITLNTSQFQTDWDVFSNPDDRDAYERAEAACDTYFTWGGCSYPDSYLNLFFERYWRDLYPEWREISREEDKETLDNLLDDFYNRHADQFVSEYAATSPDEDIAESFLFFVLQPAPAGNTIADEKILFFYEFPELVEVRASMRGALCPPPAP